MKVQAVQANTNVPAPKHLVYQFRIQSQAAQNKTKFLWARIDICADVNIMQVSI